MALPRIAEGEIVTPTFKSTAFHCPRCGVYAPQEWAQLHYNVRVDYEEWTPTASNGWISTCQHCDRDAYWVEGFWMVDGTPQITARMVEPQQTLTGPRPHTDMPDDVRADYEEARAIVSASPRGACALLRFALQTLLQNHLGQQGKDPNAAIKALVAAGLPVETQQALDVLRVVGNNAVHPLEMDLRDDTETATALFAVINFIVQDRIAQPKKLKGLFDALPQGARDAIAKRDATT
ncbi:DUF4145 domain-containing protein [Capillimicrobium parvum]|uniref:DUF4145 domain-containing protein n=1 Tax=Capillimicrobium parvum TaxID=2884022 RepID=A0A9E6XXU2_9ACTN|nr:DUF4145 domain-containing protein [Capillimicrobium parvum]UGS36098.1 hypothetical protein DSM104329_02496 [Capillimicrobium parvum]